MATEHYYRETVKQMRSYIERNQPQTFAMTWNLFLGLFNRVKASRKDVWDIFEYARQEKIERFGKEIDVSPLYRQEKSGVKTYRTAAEIKAAFIKEGWSKDIEMTETLGPPFTPVKGRKYFTMVQTGNVYDDRGNIACFNIPVKSERSGR